MEVRAVQPHLASPRQPGAQTLPRLQVQVLEQTTTKKEKETMTWIEQDDFLKDLSSRLKPYGFINSGTGTYLPTNERDYSWYKGKTTISATVKTYYITNQNGTVTGPTSRLIHRIACRYRKQKL